MKAHKSALKHGINENAGIDAAENRAYIADPDDDNPSRQFRLGFDPSGRLLELVVLRFDSGNDLLIRAMNVRRNRQT
uniref:toxin n=1 Tax=Rhodococcus qingshengii TaxID=334542 RepID=UPI001C4E272A|nr:toxin [Rhodococcus qingshengii]